jgi:hypothetical protein
MLALLVFKFQEGLSSGVGFRLKAVFSILKNHVIENFIHAIE